MFASLPPADLTMLSGLIDLLRDPAKAQAQIEELKAAQADLSEVRAAAAKDLEETKTLTNELAARENDLAKKEAEFIAKAAQWDAERTATSAEIAKIQDNLRVAGKDVLERERRAVAAELDLAERVKAADDREFALEHSEQATNKLKADLESRLSRIKEAAA